MSDVSITPEDRERLARGKFLDWLFEGFDDDRINKKLDERIDARITSFAGGQRPPQQQQQQQEGSQGSSGIFTQEPAPRRRSLLEACLSDTFGF